MLCKNESCEKETNGSNVYCSSSCRNVYINKNTIDYNKVSKSLIKTLGRIKDDKINEYKKNPKICKFCKKEIDYERRKNNMCSVSCSNKNRKGCTYTFSEEGLNSIRKAIFERYPAKKEKHCKMCNILIINKNKVYCSFQCRVKKLSENTDSYRRYKSSCNFNFELNAYPKYFDFSLIEKYGWYRPTNWKNPNIGGVSRDHILSINDGYKNKIDPSIVSHPANCRLMVHSKNIAKNKKSDYTIDELIIAIHLFESKYGKYNR
jgi:hypothetical protein